jgi:hypothetical protein
MNRRSLLLLLPLAACAQGAGGGVTPVVIPTEQVALPPNSIEGAGDPTRAAVSRVAIAFANPGVLIARPGAAARAIADMEYLAAWLPRDPRYTERGNLLAGKLQEAKVEWRQALNIPANQPAQPLITAMYNSWTATQQGNRQAAAAALPGGEAMFTRLGALPPLPRTYEAATLAAQVQGVSPDNRSSPRR